jgi:hypothetical protein
MSTIFKKTIFSKVFVRSAGAFLEKQVDTKNNSKYVKNTA